MKQLSVGAFFSEPSGLCHVEEDVDNNISARLAAHIAGFTQEHHSIMCAACANLQHCVRSPLCLEEGGLFILPFHVIFFQQNKNCLSYQVICNWLKHHSLNHLVGGRSYLVFLEVFFIFGS